MKRSPHQITFVILVSALVLSAGFVLRAERERTDESSAPQSSVTIEQAIAIAKEKFPGHVLEAELENEDDNTIFEIKIASASGEIREFAIDAQSGQVLDEEREPEHTDESNEEDD